MAKTFPRQRIRVRLDVTSDGNAVDAITNATPRCWRGTDIQFDLGFFYKRATATDTDVLDVTNVETLTVEAKAADDLTGPSHFEKTILAADFDGTAPTTTTWDDGSAQHCSVALTKEETLLDLDDGLTRNFRVIVWVTTTDDPDRKIVYGSFLLRVDETGVFGNDNAPLTYRRPGLTALLSQRSAAGGLWVPDDADPHITGSGVALGLSDGTFSMVVQREDYTTETTLWESHESGNNRVAFVQFDQEVLLQVTDGAGTETEYTLTIGRDLVAGQTYHLAVTLDRDGLASLYLNAELMDTVSIAASSAVDIGSGNAGDSRGLIDFYGTFYALTVFNRVLTADEVEQLAFSGVVHLADQWGELTPTYESDFSAGVDGWTGVLATPAAADSIGGMDDTLGITGDGSAGIHYVYKAVAPSLKRFRLQFDYYVPAANVVAVDLAYGLTASLENTAPGGGSWLSVDTILYAPALIGTPNLRFGLAGSGGVSITTSETIYVKDIKVTPVGAVLDLDVPNATTTGTTDRSSNGLDVTHYQATPALVVPQLNPETLTVGGGTVLAKLLSATASLDFASILAAATAVKTITVTGAALGDSVALGRPNGLSSDISLEAWVSAADTVSVRARNHSGSAVDPASLTYRVTVFQF